MCLVENEENVI